jgi:hypothetical protein
MKPKKRLGGWQCWVDVYDSYVIKTPKSRDEIREEVEKYLRWKNKLEELEERTDKMISDMEKAKRIITKSKVPTSYLADLEFIEGGKIKQKKVIPLDLALKKLNKKERLALIDKIAKFLLKMWEYGIHEYTYKFFSNLGLDNQKIVFIDPFEITSSKASVLKQIKKQKWKKPEKFKKHLSDKEVEYLFGKLNKTFTEENLKRYWKKR